MEKNQKNSKSNGGACGKFYRAINPFRRNRRVPNNQQPASSNRLSTTPKPPPQKTLHVIQPTKPVMHPHKPASSIPINFDFSSHPENGHMQNGHAGKTPARGNNEGVMSRTESAVLMNDKFSAFIDGVRNKMQYVDSESEVVDGNGKTSSHLDDRVNEFIHNARIKIRTTSSSLGTAHSFSVSKGI